MKIRRFGGKKKDVDTAESHLVLVFRRTLKTKMYTSQSPTPSLSRLTQDWTSDGNPGMFANVSDRCLNMNSYVYSKHEERLGQGELTLIVGIDSLSL